MNFMIDYFKNNVNISRKLSYYLSCYAYITDRVCRLFCLNTKLFEDHCGLRLAGEIQLVESFNPLPCKVSCGLALSPILRVETRKNISREIQND